MLFLLPLNHISSSLFVLLCFSLFCFVFFFFVCAKFLCLWSHYLLWSLAWESILFCKPRNNLREIIIIICDSVKDFSFYHKYFMHVNLTTHSFFLFFLSQYEVYTTMPASFLSWNSSQWGEKHAIYRNSKHTLELRAEKQSYRS